MTDMQGTGRHAGDPRDGGVARRFREALADPGSFATVVELVPWRGGLADEAGERARGLARELHDDPRIDAVSITDNAGGHAMLSPEVLAHELAGRGQAAIVHIACRDRNRNELLSLAWRLSSAGVENLLVLSGDYPTEGYLGVAKPVFDLDSVGLLHLYAGLNEGRLADAVVGRPVPRDRATRVPALGAVRGAGGPPSAATDFFLGVAVNPFKTVEADVVPQYLKLEMKARMGARYAITQVGFDPRKLDELVRYVRDRHLPLALLANVFVLTRTTARIFHAGDVPGVTLPDPLLALVDRQAASPDRGKAFFLELAARQVAIARGLGFAGAYLGGSSRAEDVGRVLELASAYAPDDWRSFVAETTFTVPRTWYAYERDPDTGLNTATPRRRSRKGSGKLGGAPLDYRLSRRVHAIAFDPASRGFRLAGRAYGVVERVHAGHAAHVLEQAVKAPLYDCRDCGDCSLPETAYLCPESQCAKNQRNGPCGGSRDGECEIPGKVCIWNRAYRRLAPYGEALTMLERDPAICDNSLRRTSAWANTFLGRDHVTRPRPGRRSTDG